MEWVSYLFETSSQVYHPTPLQSIVGSTQHHRRVYSWLHILGNHLERTIDLRTTTELVQGLPSPLADVRKMYQS